MIVELVGFERVLWFCGPLDEGRVGKVGKKSKVRMGTGR